jgi:prepilin-type N-terminal cleavage/methylation domain-containing protein
MKRLALKNHGFTMIEIVTVLVVLFIVSTAVMSRYTTTGTNELMAETDGLKASLRYAQIKAMGDTLQPDKNTRWEIYVPNANTYTLYRRADNNMGIAINLPGEVPLSPTHALPAGVTITSGVGLVIGFDDWGSPGTSNKVIQLSQGGNSTTITITKNTGFIP